MIERRKIPGINAEVSVISLGTWLYSGVENGGKWGPTDGDEVYKALEKGLEKGINFFDGGVYGHGLGEKALGRLIKNCRKDVVITTKLGEESLVPDKILPKIEHSLEDFQSDYIDVCFFHWPSRKTPIRESLEVMNKLKDKGIIRGIGVSNFTPALLKEAVRHAKISVCQPGYNYFFRYIEDEIIPICEKNSIAVIPYSCLGRGLLTGKLKKDHKFAEGDDRPGDLLFQEPIFSQCLQALEEVKELANRKRVTVTQVVLRWTLKQPGITSALIGARNQRQLEDSLGFADVELDEQDMDDLNRISNNVWKKISDLGHRNLFLGTEERIIKQAEELNCEPINRVLRAW